MYYGSQNAPRWSGDCFLFYVPCLLSGCVRLEGCGKPNTFAPGLLLGCFLSDPQASSPSSPAPESGGKKDKKEKKGTVWHDGAGRKQLGQKAKEALDKSKVNLHRE